MDAGQPSTRDVPPQKPWLGPTLCARLLYVRMPNTSPPCRPMAGHRDPVRSVSAPRTMPNRQSPKNRSGSKWGMMPIRVQ